MRSHPMLASIVAALFAGLLGVARADEVPVVVAANFAAVMPRLSAAFERDSGHRLVVSVGSTGRFAAQIRQGAPFEVLLSADAETPARLEREGLAIAGTRFTYATGRLALWSRDAGRVDAQGDVLRTGRFERLAIAEPKLAPYGAAAMQVLAALGLETALRPRLVLGDSVGQAHQFVATGNAELGFVALAQVQTDGRVTQGSAWIVPAGLHAPLRQDAVMLRPGRGRPAAEAFLRWLRGDAARALIRGHGYEA